MKLEKLRMYFCVVGWQLLSKVFPNHRIFTLFKDVINSPEYLRDQMAAENDDLDLLSLSLSSMGKIPQYHILGLNKGEILSGDTLVVKSEPAGDMDE